LHIALDHGVVKIRQAKAATAATAAHFAAAVLLGDHRDRQADQRAHIGRQRAVGAGHHDHVVFGGQTGHDLHHPWIFGAGDLFHTAEQVHFVRAVHGGHRVERGIEGAAGGDLARRHFDALVLCRSANGAHRHGRVHQRSFRNVVRIGKGGFLARHGPHTHTLVDAEAAGFDDALFQTPAFGAGVLEIQIGIIDRVGFDGVQGLRQVAFIQAKRLEQEGPGRGQAFDGRFA
jgi:hypothetical protein